jgi:hypothetical protein
VKVFPGESSTFLNANDNDASGYRNPLGGVVMGTLSMYGSG